ncbi:Putative ATP binding protein [Dehalococcoides mccartyi]|uniref:ATP binding protein n=2 Tax=root TaxID=1 RepID=A0AB33HRQ0_9CHLR|nr:diphthine--ammonia ligase [Dehalococcoides mccartyi]BAZ97966.1 Putative ATP binding protein [Dehalococcoides mccartyi]
MSIVVSWSGGKDCNLAFYLATQQGLDVRCLITAVDHTGRMGAHALKPSVLSKQAEAIGVPLLVLPVTVSTYDDDFREQLQLLKKTGVHGAVFGDVDLGNCEAKLHRGWIESICNPIDITAFIPLWFLDRETILRKLIDLGFDVRFVVVDDANFSPEWLGKKLDNYVIDELKSRAERSPEGKVGYYHTIVLDGPIFKKRLRVVNSDKVHKSDEWGDNWYWDISSCCLEDKVFTK